VAATLAARHEPHLRDTGGGQHLRGTKACISD
jgi:hypothetical protein